MKFDLLKHVVSMEYLINFNSQWLDDQKQVDEFIAVMIKKLNEISDEQLTQILNDTVFHKWLTKEAVSKIPSNVKASYAFWKSNMHEVIGILHSLTADDVVGSSKKWKDMNSKIDAIKNKFVIVKKFPGIGQVSIPAWSKDISDIYQQQMKADLNGDESDVPMSRLGFSTKEDIVTLINAVNCIYSVNGDNAKLEDECRRMLDLKKVTQLCKEIIIKTHGEIDDEDEYGLQHYGPLAFLREDLDFLGTRVIPTMISNAYMYVVDDLNGFISKLGGVKVNRSIWKRIIDFIINPFKKS